MIRNTVKVLMLAAVIGGSAMTTQTANAWWGWGPFDWFDGPGWGGPWGGYPYYGGRGYPYGSYPAYGVPYPGVPAAPDQPSGESK